MPAHGRAGARATPFLAALFAKQKTKFGGGGKARAGREFILTANQAQIAALRGNFSEKKNFLKKIGSNPLLRERLVFVEYKNSWKLLENSSAEARGEAPSEAGNQNFTNWLRDLDSNQDYQIQSLAAYR